MEGFIIKHKFKSSNRVNFKKLWFVTFFVTAIFFITSHNFNFSRQNSIINNQYFRELSRTVFEGSTKRQLALFLLGIFGIIGIIRDNRKSPRLNSLGALIIIFIAWAFLSLFWAEDFSLTIKRLVVLLVFCLGAFAVSLRFSIFDIIVIVFTSTVFNLALGLLAEILLGTVRPWDPGYRFGGTLHPNHQGINCALLFISGMYLFKLINRRKKLFLISASIGLLFLVLTGSRTSFAVCLLAYLSYQGIIIRKSFKSSSLFCMMIVITSSLLLFSNTFLPYLGKIVLLGRSDTNQVLLLSGRSDVWQYLIANISNRPFLGYGYNSFWNPKNIYEVSKKSLWGVAEGHSIYLDLILGIGIAGLALYILILVIAFRTSYKSDRSNRNCGYGFFAVLILFCLMHGLMESAMLNVNILTFISFVALAHLGYNKFSFSSQHLKSISQY